MNPLTIYRIYCVSRALTPITHMAGSSGNESVLQREKIITDSGEHWVPFLSGNAIRHKALREPIMHDLVTRLGLKGNLTLEQANFLFHGGAMSESAGNEDLGMIRRIQDILPAIRLLGGSLTNRILDGRIRVDRGTLACAENVSRLNEAAPEGFEFPSNLMGAKQFEGNYQYTRTDIRRLASLDTVSQAESEREHQSGLMIFAGQSVVPGSVFVHDFRFQGTEIELGCILHGLMEWQRKGGVIGGQSSRGHGKLATKWTITGYDSPESQAIELYHAHIEANKEAAIDWLNEAFKPREKKGKKSA